MAAVPLQYGAPPSCAFVGVKLGYNPLGYESTPSLPTHHPCQWSPSSCITLADNAQGRDTAPAETIRLREVGEGVNNLRYIPPGLETCKKKGERHCLRQVDLRDFGGPKNSRLKNRVNTPTLTGIFRKQGSRRKVSIGNFGAEKYPVVSRSRAGYNREAFAAGRTATVSEANLIRAENTRGIVL